jgi:hypothetical protein
LHRVSRNDHVQLRLQAPDCGRELVIYDEARKMSAKVFGRDIEYTQALPAGAVDVDVDAPLPAHDRRAGHAGGQRGGLAQTLLPVRYAVQ